MSPFQPYFGGSDVQRVLSAAKELDQWPVRTDALAAHLGWTIPRTFTALTALREMGRAKTGEEYEEDA